jgi:antitoxin YefM
VNRDRETLVISRGKDKAVVILSLDEYNEMLTTQHELSSRRNQDRLDQAISNMRSGNTFQKELIEP